MKRTLFIFTILAAVLFRAGAQETFEYNGVKYKVISMASKTAAVITNADYSWNPGTYSGDIVIPSTAVFDEDTFTVTTLSAGSFSKCAELTGVSLPASIILIEDGAFNGNVKLASITVDEANENYASLDGVLCTKDLTKILAYPNKLGTEYVVPASVTAIGKSAFAGSIDLQAITFHENVMQLGQNTFEGCTALTTVELPSKLTEVPNGCFLKCSNLQTVTFPETVSEIGMRAFDECRKLNNVVIPDAVTVLKSYSFLCGEGLTNITLPKNLKTIEMMAVHGGFTKIDLPETLETIESSGIISSNLEELVIPPLVTSLRKLGGQKLKKIVLPEGFIKLGYQTFSNCPELVEINLPESMTSIGNSGSFEGASSLETITIPSGITKLEDATFRGCSSLKTVLFAENSKITRFGWDEFGNCTSLTSFTIPAGVSEVGFGIFSGCTSLTELTVDNPVPPSPSMGIPNNPFAGLDQTKCTLYVPKGTIEAYKAARYWQNFTNIVEKTPTSTASIGLEDMEVYSEKGIVFVKNVPLSSKVEIFSVNGVLLKSSIAGESQWSVDMRNAAYSVCIVKVGEKAVKIVL